MAARYGRYDQNKQDDKNMDETSADVDELTNEIHSSKRDNIASNLVDRFKTFKDDLESSFDRERSGMEEYFENEKHDIMKGFLLEKKILNREHEKEKEDLVKTFVKERQKMLSSFQEQVGEIETKMRKTTPTKENVISIASDSGTVNDLSDAKSSQLKIRLDGNRIVTPQEFLATLELEEKFESEKEVIKKSFRKEKERMKDKMEVDYERKLIREKQKHEDEIKELQRDIENLKNLKFEVSSIWKEQATKLDKEFQKERNELEKHYKEEREILKHRLEDRNDAKLRKQQHEYDRSITELKSELKRIKHDAVKHEHVTVDHTTRMKEDVTKQLRESFERETKIIREQNEKLSEDVKQLTTEKYKLSQNLREMELKVENESKLKEQEIEKRKKEYEQKTKKLVNQIDKLKIHLKESEKQKQCLSDRASSNEADSKNIEERLILTERTVSECEDTIIGMRIENTNLSHEINLLRTEKEDLLKTIEGCQESERSMKVETKKLEKETNDINGCYALLEREKLQQEKLIAKLRKELETIVHNNKETQSKYASFEKETNRIRQLLDGERKENKRLHTRFKQDAELLRKKDTENQNIKSLLENLKMEFENLKSNINMDNEKVLQISSEKEALLKEVEKLKSIGTLQHQKDIVTIQNQYVKEFAKRLDYVKSNYEREIKDLKNTIETLKHIKTQSACIDRRSPPCSWKDENMSPKINCSSLQPDEKMNSCSAWEPKLNSTKYENTKLFNKSDNNGIKSTTDQRFQYLINSTNQDDTKPHEWNDIAERLKQPVTESNTILNHRDNRSAFHPVSHHQSTVQKQSPQITPKKVYPWSNTDDQRLPDIPSRTLKNDSNHERLSKNDVYTDLMNRVSSAESNRDDEELRKLLKDVRTEVLQLNKMIDEHTPNSTPRRSPPTQHVTISPNQSNTAKSHYDDNNQKLQNGKSNHYNTQNDEMNRLYEENNELQRRISQQQDELTKQGFSCDELLQRRITLEKLVDRLQGKLRHETSRRRQLEQEKNKIQEEPFDHLDDDSTV